MRTEKRSQAEGSSKKADREVARESDANDLNDTAPYGNAKVKSTDADFNRNRDGLYGGLPDARKRNAPGGKADKPHPQNNPADPRAPQR
ncbi:MAG TPA: hypothetical protein VGH02_09425 [Rhizomicrobium sp.]|jgi:hypothetical protein